MPNDQEQVGAAGGFIERADMRLGLLARRTDLSQPLRQTLHLGGVNPQQLAARLQLSAPIVRVRSKWGTPSRCSGHPERLLDRILSYDLALGPVQRRIGDGG